MITEASQTRFLAWCPSCKRRHRMQYQPCPTCEVCETPQPASARVADRCYADYSCDGCIAYREHQS